MSVVDDQQAAVSALERARYLVIEGVQAEMYKNPFWDARFGERGRLHTRKDTGYHLDRLITAIQIEDPSSFARYYRWVRGLLVRRGICSRHLQETLDVLAGQLSRHAPQEWPLIEPYLQAGYTGLEYEMPACRTLASQQEELAQSVTARLFSGQAEEAEAARRACYRDLLYHLSYLLDAVEHAEPEIFRAYLRWLAEFLPRFDVEMASVHRSLTLIAEQIERNLDAGEARFFTSLLRA